MARRVEKSGKDVDKAKPKAKRKAGRPKGSGIKLTPELKALVIAHLLAGNYVETAAQAAGVNKTTLYDWLKKGAKGEQPYQEFSNAVVAAQAAAEARDVQRLDTHGLMNWQAVAWRLERRHPDRWGRRERVEVQQETTHYVVEVPPKMDRETWQQRYGHK